jgi:hypothetical protein
MRYLRFAVCILAVATFSACAQSQPADSSDTADSPARAGAEGIITVEALRTSGQIAEGAPSWVTDPAATSAMDTDTHIHGVGCAELRDGSMADASKSQAMHRALDEMTKRTATDVTVTEGDGERSSSTTSNARFGAASILESWSDETNRVIWLLVRAEK